MNLSRRELLAALSTPLFGQGIATRGVAPTPRGKPSGLPFHAHFTDIAAAAGLTRPVIYGDDDESQLHPRNDRLRRRFPRLRQRRLARHLRAERHPARGSARPAPPTGCTRTIATARFTDVTEKAGLRRTGWASAVTVGDYNNDGFDDLFVTYWGQNVLYRNNGDGTFTDVTERGRTAAPSSDRWGSGCTFVDYDRDGHLDLFVANYLDFDRRRVPSRASNANCNWKGIPVDCGPRGLPPGAVRRSITTTATAPSPTSARHPASRRPKAATR